MKLSIEIDMDGLRANGINIQDVLRTVGDNLVDPSVPGGTFEFEGADGNVHTIGHWAMV